MKMESVMKVLEDDEIRCEINGEGFFCCSGWMNAFLCVEIEGVEERRG